MIQTTCQWLLVIAVTVTFFMNVYSDFHGTNGRRAAGFSGFIASLLGAALAAFTLYGAGAFTQLLGTAK